MRSYLGFVLLICVAAATDVVDKTTTPATTAKSEQRDKRQLMASNAAVSLPVYLDNFNPSPPVEPIKPVQPVTVVTPVVSNTAGPGYVPGFPQNLPIVGTLLTSLPLQNLLTSLNLGQLGNLGNLGNLGQLGGLGNLVNLGQTPNLPTFGGGKPGGNVGIPPQTCPLTQRLSCRCEPLVSLPLRQPENQQMVQIVKQNARHNTDGSQELRMELSNGHVFYQRLEKDATEQHGFYALPFPSGHFLSIRYSINQANYTIKAEVDSSPPSTDFDL